MKTAYAWLVVNGFIESEKFRQIFSWLVEAAEKQQCILEIKTNTQLLPKLVMGEEELLTGCRRPQFVIFWDKDVRLARLLEKLGLRLFNCAQSIEICDDKFRAFGSKNSNAKNNHCAENLSDGRLSESGFFATDRKPAWFSYGS